MRPILIAIALVAATGACGKNKSGPGAASGGAAGTTTGPAPSHASGTPHTDAVVDAWKRAGLKPEGFKLVEPLPYGAAYCEEGVVQGVDTLVCEFADDGAIDRGQKLLKDDWTREGVQTGVVLRTKRTLLAAVDRGRHDPNGKTINQLVMAFRKL